MTGTGSCLGRKSVVQQCRVRLQRAHNSRPTTATGQSRERRRPSRPEGINESFLNNEPWRLLAVMADGGRSCCQKLGWDAMEPLNSLAGKHLGSPERVNYTGTVITLHDVFGTPYFRLNIGSYGMTR